MPDNLISSQVDVRVIFFAGTVLVASMVGGVAFGGLLCFRRYRRTGVLGLAATCAGLALIVVVTEIVQGGDTISHALTVTAGLIGFFPILGAVLTCVIIGIARLLWTITRRVGKAIWNFSDNVLKDVLSLVTRPSGQERRPRTLSKASRFSLMFVVLTGSVVVALNIGAISDLATRVAPRLSIVNNVLDLISFILVTPKLFTIEPRDDVNHQRIQRGGRSRFRRRTRNLRSRNQ